MQTTIAPAEVQPADMIVAVSGHILPRPITVTRVIAPGHVQVEQPADWQITPDRYLDTFQSVTVKRVEPKKRQVTRTFGGVKFIRQGDGRWITEDGLWETSLVDDFETDCDAEHPCKIPAWMRGAWNKATEFERQRMFSFDIRQALREGKKGYLCPGGEVHFYSQWVAGATPENPRYDQDEVVNREDTFTESAAHLAAYINGDAESAA